jgi:hypothetical protein
MNSIKTYRIYFTLLLTTCLCVIFFGDKSVEAHGVTLFMLASAPLFFITYSYHFNKFSDQVEKDLPGLYEQYKIPYGILKRINVLSVFNNEDFEKIENPEIKHRLSLSKKLLGLTLLSFGTIIATDINLILVKR